VFVGNLKIKNGKKVPKEVSADEKGRLIKAVARYCRTWPTGSKLLPVGEIPQ